MESTSRFVDRFITCLNTIGVLQLETMSTFEWQLCFTYMNIRRISDGFYFSHC